MKIKGKEHLFKGAINKFYHKKALISITNKNLFYNKKPINNLINESHNCIFNINKKTINEFLIKIPSKNFNTPRKPIINQTSTNLHNHYRYDGLNEIRFNKHQQKEIVKRENEIFKNWKKLLNHYLNDWEKAVNKFAIKEKIDIGENIGEYVYFEETTEEGYDILYRRNLKTNKKDVVLDIKKIPFLIDINKTVLKSLRICPLQKRVSFIVDLENKERYTGGIYDIGNKEFYKLKLDNVNAVEFSQFENYYIIIENDEKNRPSKIKGIYLDFNLDKKGLKNYCEESSQNLNKEILLFEEKNHNIFIETAPSKDNKFLIINSQTKTDSAIYTLKLNQLEAKPIEILKRSKSVKYFTDHANVL